MSPEQAPKRIFLRRDAADLAMWFEEKSGNDDVEYIRADLARPTPSPSDAPKVDPEACTHQNTELVCLDCGPSPSAPLVPALEALREFAGSLRKDDEDAWMTSSYDAGQWFLGEYEKWLKALAALSPSSTAPSPDAEKVKCDSCMSERDPACPACAGAGWFWAPSEGREKGLGPQWVGGEGRMGWLQFPAPGEKGKEEG